MTVEHTIANILIKQILTHAYKTADERKDMERILARIVFPSPGPGTNEEIIPSHDQKHETSIRAKFTEDRRLIDETVVLTPWLRSWNVTWQYSTCGADVHVWTKPHALHSMCRCTTIPVNTSARKDVERAIRRTADTWSEVLEAERAAWAKERNKLLDDWKDQVDEMRGTLDELRVELKTERDKQGSIATELMNPVYQAPAGSIHEAAISVLRRLVAERDAAKASAKYHKEELYKIFYGHDWTAVDGRSNSSPEYMEIAAQVEALIRDSAGALLAGQSSGVARHIVSHLAHKLGMRPMCKRDSPS